MVTSLLKEDTIHVLHQARYLCSSRQVERSTHSCWQAFKKSGVW